MAQQFRILIIEDSEADCALLLRMLGQAGYELLYQRVETAEELEAALRAHSWECVISDFSLPGFSGISALKIVRENDPDVPFIFVSGTIGEDIAVDAMRGGAQDYVLKGNLAACCLPSIGKLRTRTLAGNTGAPNKRCNSWRNLKPSENWPAASPTTSTT